MRTYRLFKFVLNDAVRGAPAVVVRVVVEAALVHQNEAQRMGNVSAAISAAPSPGALRHRP